MIEVRIFILSHFIRQLFEFAINHTQKKVLQPYKIPSKRSKGALRLVGTRFPMSIDLSNVELERPQLTWSSGLSEDIEKNRMFVGMKSDSGDKHMNSTHQSVQPDIF